MKKLTEDSLVSTLEDEIFYIVSAMESPEREISLDYYKGQLIIIQRILQYYGLQDKISHALFCDYIKYFK